MESSKAEFIFQISKIGDEYNIQVIKSRLIGPGVIVMNPNLDLFLQELRKLINEHNQ